MQEDRAQNREERKRLLDAVQRAHEHLDRVPRADDSEAGPIDPRLPVVRAFAEFAPLVNDWKTIKDEREKVIGALTTTLYDRAASHMGLAGKAMRDIGKTLGIPVIRREPMLVTELRDFFSSIASSPADETQHLEALSERRAEIEANLRAQVEREELSADESESKNGDS